jgi:hypothetical protein
MLRYRDIIPPCWTIRSLRRRQLGFRLAFRPSYTSGSAGTLFDAMRRWRKLCVKPSGSIAIGWIRKSHSQSRGRILDTLGEHLFA